MGVWIELELRGTAYLAAPAAGVGPGVLVFHAWWGLNLVFVDVCDRLASQGFLALAPDLYGDGSIATSIDDAEALLAAADGGAMVARATAAYDALIRAEARSGSRVGAIGYSMGASVALDLSQRRRDVAAVVVFYGTEEGPFDSSDAEYLGHFAENDEWEPTENVMALEAALASARRPATILRYPNVHHWFFETDRPEYDRQAADLAWARTLRFMSERLT